MHHRGLLIIVEQNILNGKVNFGSSNDLLLINQALGQNLGQNFKVYLTTPQKIAQQHQFNQFPALRLSENLDHEKINNKIKESWQCQTVNYLLALGSNADDGNDLEGDGGKMLFYDAQIEFINLGEVPIFNRAEPISLTNQFYDILIGWQKSGAKILPNPNLNKILGDKLAIDAIHNNTKVHHAFASRASKNQRFSGYQNTSKDEFWYNSPINDIDLLSGVLFQEGENKISFESKIIPISKNNLNAEEIAQFYNFLIIGNFQKAEEVFSDEYQIFMQGVKKYLLFHQKLNNDSIIKPASYFGGTGIVVAKNQNLNFEQAIQNIIQSFLAIKADCQKNDRLDLAFLPTIIVQQRATAAHLGDLRIIFCGNNLQGIFVRVNPDFEKSKANNLHIGGHPESLFKNYQISKAGVDLMIDDMKKSGLDEKDEEIKKANALYGLLKTIDFLQQIKILQQYPIIGIDALLTKDKNNNYRYGINEINLTSPMGQTQLLILQMAVKFNHLALEILLQQGFDITLEKYQILADYFKNQNHKIALQAKEILLKDQHLQNLISEETKKLLADNPTTATLKYFIN